jgi:hypothetical protein
VRGVAVALGRHRLIELVQIDAVGGDLRGVVNGYAVSRELIGRPKVEESMITEGALPMTV